MYSWSTVRAGRGRPGGGASEEASGRPGWGGALGKGKLLWTV